MEILFNAVKGPHETDPTQEICEHCESQLNVDWEDTEEGAYGGRYFMCPCCGKKSYCENIGGITLHKDNVEFPIHFEEIGNINFDDFSEDDISFINKNIKKMLNDGVNEFRYVECRDLLIIILNDDIDEYHIVVTNKYCDTYIKKERD